MSDVAAQPDTLGLLAMVFKRITGSLARKMEKRADLITKRDEVRERVYALTLEKLYRAKHIPAVAHNKCQAHPHLYDQLMAAAAKLIWAGELPFSY